jgi:hypothetical protein
MRTLVIVFTLAGSGCLGVSDYERMRSENAELRGENAELRRDLIHANAKLALIDAVIHDEVVAPPPRTDEGR